MENTKEALKNLSTQELERKLDILLCTDNSGGLLANDIIAELSTRDDYVKPIEEKKEKKKT